MKNLIFFAIGFLNLSLIIFAQGDEKWDNRFFRDGFNGPVYVLTKDQNGNIYAGGNFSHVDKLKTFSIAKWNGSEWVNLGKGLYKINLSTNQPEPANISDILLDGNDLYIVGDFQYAGDVQARYIAKWSNGNWHAVGSFQNFPSVYINTIEKYQNEIYVGGSFQNSTYDSLFGVLKLNGDNFVDVGFKNPMGVSAGVSTMTVFNNELYVAGSFTQVAGQTYNNIARWNGNSWSDVGGGFSSNTAVSSSIQSLFVDNNTLIAAGYFTSAGNVTANNIARWNNTSWEAIGNLSGFSERLRVIQKYNGELYTSTVEGGTLYKFDGSNWVNLGNFSSGAVNALLEYNGKLLIGGSYKRINIGNTGFDLDGYLSVYDGTNFSQFKIEGKGLNDEVQAIAVGNDGSVYVGGKFYKAGNQTIWNIAKWDGTNWQNLGGVGGTQGVRAIVVTNNGDVYVGGQFTSVGNPAITVQNIARWNGTTWQNIGGFTSRVNTLATDGVNVYAGGKFGIKKYNGSTWSDLGTGVNDEVFSIAISGNDVYVAGKFTTAGGNPANKLAKWDGTAWSEIPQVPNIISGNYNPLSLLVDGNYLYVGGNIYTSDGSISGIGRWDGTSWSSLGSGLLKGVNGWVYSIAKDNSGNIYVGGQFTMAGDTAIKANRIAIWDGTNWSTLGSGVSGKIGSSLDTRVSALQVAGSKIYIGGTFTEAGNKPSYGFAVYDYLATSIADDKTIPNEFSLAQNYPNPFNPSTTISFTIPQSEFVTLKVYDILGREVATLVNENLTAGNHTYNFDASKLTSGVYFYKLQTGKFSETKKMILMK